MIETVIYDVDGVLLDWVGAFNSWVEAKGFRRKETGEDRYNLWERFEGMTPLLSDQLIQEFAVSSAYGQMRWIEGAHAGVVALRNSFPTSRHVVVTSCGHEIETLYMRAAQLRGMGFHEFHPVAVGAEKRPWFSGGGRTLVIEDSPHHLESARAAGCITIALAQPWNKEWDGPRARTWDELPALARDLARERLKGSKKSPGKKAAA